MKTWLWNSAKLNMTNLLLLSHFSCVRLCATPETAAYQAPPSLRLSRQEHWSGLPFPSPMHESEKWKWSRSVVSDSLQRHGLQPIRLLHPWDFPGKSTGVGCCCPLHDKPRQHIKKQRHYFASKGPYIQSYGFSSRHVWCASWTIKKTEGWRIDTFELWCWRRISRVPWTAQRSNQSVLKEINPERSLERLMLKL